MSQENNYVLSVNNKEIWEFFNENPTVDFETAVLIIIDIFELTMKNAENTINSKINTRILSAIGEHSTQLRELKTEVGSLKGDIMNTLLTKFVDMKRDYTEEVKNIVQVNNLSSTLSSEKISSLIEKTNSTLIDKTKQLLSDIVPRTNDAYYRQIQESIQAFEKNIIQETRTLVTNSGNETTINEFIKSFELKSNSLMQSIQTPLYNFITASEERINANLVKINDHSIGSSLTQEKLVSSIDEFLNKNKYLNSSIKGKTGETQLEDILNQMFPSCMVKNTSGTTASGDFILQQRENQKPNILFENKQYSVNVNNEEVNKFIRDMKQQNTHGIFISQTSGIVCKQQFEIQILDNLVAVYILNCNYDSDKIKIAVDIVDKISSCLSRFATHENLGENINITPDILNEINVEYGRFSSQKLALIESMKNMTRDMLKRVIEQVDDLKFPSLDTFLSNKLGTITIQGDEQMICDICNKFTATNKRAMGAHKKGCSKKSSIEVATPTINVLRK